VVFSHEAPLRTRVERRLPALSGPAPISWTLSLRRKSRSLRLGSFPNHARGFGGGAPEFPRLPPQLVLGPDGRPEALRHLAHQEASCREQLEALRVEPPAGGHSDPWSERVRLTGADSARLHLQAQLAWIDARRRHLAE